ncbi:MAG: hypothetical protein JXA37_08605 [Chloroflexia bacterium]|nr:hypothetical protein [Chloroflexia bacterium]
MNCPRCGQEHFDPRSACPACAFSGDPERIEQWDRLRFLLAEIAEWTGIPDKVRRSLYQRYERQAFELAVELGLRRRPLDPQAAEAARREVLLLNGLLRELALWAERGWLDPAVQAELRAEAEERRQELLERLAAAPQPPPGSSSAGRRSVQVPRLQVLRFLQRRLDELQAAGRLRSAQAYAEASQHLAAQAEAMERALGRRRPRQQPTAAAPPPAAPPAPPTRPRRPPLTWERFWEGLLSERTLRALLLIGVLLIFASAATLIVWNWETFPPWLQVAFLVLLTASFYLLGGYARARMGLHRTGVGLTLAASVLVPLDFLALYFSGLFPPDWGLEVWLLASSLGLFAYLLTTYLLQEDLFGYLVLAAALSTLAAALALGRVPLAWWQAPLAGLVLVLALLAALLERGRGRWRVLEPPFWQGAPLAAAALMLLGLGWGAVSGLDPPGLMAALALNWWCGTGTALLAAWHYRHFLLGLAAALCGPVAAWLTLRVLFQRLQIDPAWYALGWALLVPVYLLASWALAWREEPAWRSYGRIALRFALGLALLAALWSLTDSLAVGVVYALLAAAAALAAALWRRPALAALCSLALLIGVWGWLSSFGSSVGQLALGWALLAILHLPAALGLRRVGGRERSGAAPLAYDAPVFAAAWGIAFLSLLPPLLSLDRSILSYALGNFAALSGWLALLLHQGEAPGLYLLLERSRRLGVLLFHWSAALALLPWLWLLWLGRRPADVYLALAYSLWAGLLFLLGLWLRRRRWPYGRPWCTAAHLAQALSLLLGWYFYDRGWTALLFLLAALFYVASARWLYRRLWLMPAGALLAAGWSLGLDWLGLPPDPRSAALALLVPAYLLAGALLERYRRVPRDFLRPLYTVALFIAFVAFVLSLYSLAVPAPADSTMLWSAAGLLLLGLGLGLYAWLFGRRGYAHLAAWLGIMAAGLVAAVYSQGRGSSAAKAALLALAYVLAERGLLWAGRSPRAPRRWRPLFRRAWRLYRRPLLLGGWAVSAGAVGLALLRNLWLLGGGRTRETWSIAGLLLVVGLYGLAAWLFRRQRYAPRFVWLAAGLAIAPWTLLAHLGWYVWGRPAAPGYAIDWALLALLELLLGVVLARRPSGRPFSRPLLVVAHLLLPVALFWGLGSVHASCWTFALALPFYLLAVWLDRRLYPDPAAMQRGRFLYAAAAALPVWALYLLAWFWPTAPQAGYGWLLFAFTPALFLGRRLARREPAYSLPLYLLSYGAALVATALLAHQRPALTIALLLDTVLAALSAWTFREPLWVYPASATLPAALLLALAEWDVPAYGRGWALIGLGGLFLGTSWLLRRRPADQESSSGSGPARYATPLLAAAFLLIALGLPLSGQERLGAIVGYGAAALLYGLAAVWLQQPLLLSPAAGLAAVPYVTALLELGVPEELYGLALWPGLALVLLLAHGVDRRWGAQLDGQGRSLEGFPWAHPGRWARAVLERLLRWWALPLYALAYAGAALGALLSLTEVGYLSLTLLLAAVAYGLATWRFRLRGWLLIAGGTFQLAALAGMRWWGGWGGADLALRFLPLTWATALAGLWVARRRVEGSPLAGWRAAWTGWSRPLYALLLLDLLAGQAAAFVLGRASAGVSLGHALLLALLATAWRAPLLAYGAPLLGLLALAQRLWWRDVGGLAWPPALALLALGYGLAGYLLKLRRQHGAGARWVAMWERPLRRSGLFLSALSLLLMAWRGLNIVRLVIRAALDWPLLTAQDPPRVQMAASVLALLGLLYLLAAVVDRRRWLGYAAVALLLGAWNLEWLLVWGMREVQWYAIPAGAYLLVVGYLEWRDGSAVLARWIDLAGMLLLLASAFGQSFGRGGLPYALLMTAEGVLGVLWAGVRKLRRFLYLGLAGTVVSVVAISINPLFTGYRWIFLLIGGIAVLLLLFWIERNMERVRQRMGRLEEWE